MKQSTEQKTGKSLRPNQNNTQNLIGVLEVRFWNPAGHLRWDAFKI